jgi:predicted Zn-ribbon and HTH transcriptional regulator
MSKQQVTEVADILKQLVSQERLRASPLQWKVVNAILKCRTSALGAHMYQCTDCGHSEPRYNSCRNRHCPKCQGADIAKWLEARAGELLPVPYFHTVFTVPHEFNALFLQNKAIMYNLLFQAVAETLKTAAKTRYGGRIGFFGVLHSWGQKMEFHPHIHCVIPGIIIKTNGELVVSKNNYFLPDRILSKLFRGIFLKHLERAYAKGNLSFHGKAKELSQTKEFQRLKNSAVTKDWVVYSKKPFAGPAAVLKYLSRYTHRVAINNARIKAHRDGVVHFTYKDYRRKAKRKIMRLKDTEFIRRFLLHTLPLRFVRIRYFGLLANRRRKDTLQRVNEQLGRAQPQDLQQSQTLLCPACKSANLIKKFELSSKTLRSAEALTIIPHREQPPPRSTALGG